MSKMVGQTVGKMVCVAQVTEKTGGFVVGPIFAWSLSKWSKHFKGNGKLGRMNKRQFRIWLRRNQPNRDLSFTGADE